MIENNWLYRLSKERIPQPSRNRMRASARTLLDVYAGFRGLSSKRALPQFLIIGAQKAGTTSLFNWLLETGAVQSPMFKEVGYFDARWHWPIKYRGYFEAKKPGLLIGEATPSYLAFPEVPERVSSLIGPDCKIIAVLRDPVSRSVSHYFHERRLGFEKRDMYTAMTEEEGLLEEAFAQGTSASRRRYILTHFSYAYRSEYSKRLAPWLEQFNRENILIVNSEKMFMDPAKTIEAAAEFLSVDMKTADNYAASNANSYVFEDERVAEYLKNRLQDETRMFQDWVY